MYSGLPADLFVPWVILLVSALPTMAVALGPVRVALLAPIALRLGGRYDLRPPARRAHVHGGERPDRHVPRVHRAVQLTGRA